MSTHRLNSSLTLLVLCLIPVQKGLACRFCSSMETDIVRELKLSKAVVLGTILTSEITYSQSGERTSAVTVIRIDTVLKNHPKLKGLKELTIPRYVFMTEEVRSQQHLFFIDCYQNGIEISSGIPFAKKSEIATFIRGILQRDRNRIEQIRFTIDYANHSEKGIQALAFGILERAKYSDWSQAVKKAPIHRLTRWLRDPNNQKSRKGYFVRMLGHTACKLKEVEPFILALLRNPTFAASTEMKDALIGYTLLAPEKGFRVVANLLLNPDGSFGSRYLAFQACRFFLHQRCDVIARPRLIQLMVRCQKLDDFADLPLDELRYAKAWHCAKLILDRPSNQKELPKFVARATLAFALECPLNCAKNYVNKIRQINPALVKSVTRALKIEKESQ